MRCVTASGPAGTTSSTGGVSVSRGRPGAGPGRPGSDRPAPSRPARMMERRASLITGSARSDRSSAERCSIARARALACAPSPAAGQPVLLLDEPSMGLAPRIVTAVFEEVARIRSTGTTILLVEQNAHQALRLADRAHVMESGPRPDRMPVSSSISRRRRSRAPRTGDPALPLRLASGPSAVDAIANEFDGG